MTTPEGPRESVHVSLRREATLRRMEDAVDGVAKAVKTAHTGGGIGASSTRLPNAQAPHLAVPNTGSMIRDWMAQRQEANTIPSSKGKVSHGNCV